MTHEQVVKSIALVAVTLVLAGQAIAADRPPQPAHSAVDDKLCTWEWKEGGGLGLWAERCKLDTGLWELTFKPDLPGFVLTIDGEDLQTVLQVFRKPADAPIDAILPELVKRGYTLATECAFEPADLSYIPKPPAGQSFYEIVPTGKRKADFDALPDNEVPDPPCGDYGTAPDGIQYFMIEAAHPDRAVFVNLGQDGTMFDPNTLTME